MMHWMFGDYGMGYGGGMGFFMIFIWILIILGIVLLIKELIGSGKQKSGKPPGSAGESAEEILKKRYTRGEISEEEYKRMRDNLR